LTVHQGMACYSTWLVTHLLLKIISLPFEPNTFLYLLRSPYITLPIGATIWTWKKCRIWN